MNGRHIVILHSGTENSARADDSDTLEEAKELAGLAEILNWQVTHLSYEQEEHQVVSALQQLQPNLVINLVQSVKGSDARIDEATALLENLKMVYTGNDTQCFRRIALKTEMKELLKKANIPTAEWFSADAAHTLPPGRYIVKSESEHCSLGIDATSIVDAAQVSGIIADRAKRFGGEWFAERFIEGREFNVSMISDGKTLRNMPVAELTFTEMPEGVAHIVDYAGKWDEDAPSFVHLHRVFPAKDGPDGKLVAELARLAHATWHCCGLKSYARIDFRVDQQNQPYVIDVNANPCLNIGVGVMAAAEEGGFKPENILEMIIDEALATA